MEFSSFPLTWYVFYSRSLVTSLTEVAVWSRRSVGCRLIFIDSLSSAKPSEGS
jgi:hypothetical protein